MSDQPHLQAGKYLVTSVRALDGLEDDGSVLVEGIANDASVTDSYGTRIRVSDAAISEYLAGNPILLFNHNADNPIGVVTAMFYDGDQLRCVARVFADARTPTGASIVLLIRNKVLRGFSIRFSCNAGGVQKRDHLALTADELDELSIVTLPSNKPSLFGVRQKGVQVRAYEVDMTVKNENIRIQDARPEDMRADVPFESIEAALREMRWENALVDGDYDEAVMMTYAGYAILTDDYGATFWRQEYSTTDGTVTLTGEPVQVLPEWVPVGAAPAESGERAQEEPEAETETPASEWSEFRAQLREEFSGFLDTLRSVAAETTQPTVSVDITPPASSTDETPMTLEQMRAVLRSAVNNR